MRQPSKLLNGVRFPGEAPGGTIGSMADTTPVRLVTRVADMLAVVPACAVQVPCSKCGCLSWLDPAMKIPEGLGDSVPVCTRCAASDEDYRRIAGPELTAMIDRSHYWADRLHN